MRSDKACEFLEGEGPRLEAIRTEAELARLNARRDSAQVRPRLRDGRAGPPGSARETALIGFCGAPWTVATYMVGGQGSADQAEARLWAYRDPQAFQRLIDLLVESLGRLSLRAGGGRRRRRADFRQLGRQPARGPVPALGGRTDQAHGARLKERHPAVPIIGFPRGAGMQAGSTWPRRASTGSSCDTAMPLDFQRAS